jgi:hypothetical protein
MPAIASTRAAIVSRAPIQPWAAAQYLQQSQEGATTWTSDPTAATPFASMREATRAALRLPSGLRAFGLPLHSELTAGADLH